MKIAPKLSTIKPAAANGDTNARTKFAGQKRGPLAASKIRSRLLFADLERGRFELGPERVQAADDPRVGSGDQRPYERSIIAPDVPITFASSKTVTPAASALEANVDRRS